VLGRRIEIDVMRADGSEFPVELAITEVQAAASEDLFAHSHVVHGIPVHAGYPHAERQVIPEGPSR
jgi:hypothetical protein